MNNEELILEILRESSEPTMSIPTLTRLTALKWRVVKETVRTLVLDGRVCDRRSVVGDSFYGLPDRMGTEASTERPSWLTKPLTGYEARMRAFAKACEDTRR